METLSLTGTRAVIVAAGATATEAIAVAAVGPRSGDANVALGIAQSCLPD